MTITSCPTCGKNNMKQIRKPWKGKALGQDYVVPSLTFYQCQDCGEQVFDRDAMRKIESVSPAYKKPQRRSA